MSNTPIVSVVIPAHNPGSYLHETIRSVLDQTLKSWECVVVDDGSTEDLTWVTSVDPRIKLVRQDNRGLPAARNTGARNSSAPFIAFLDSDDVWLPDKLRKQVALMAPEVSLSATAFYRFGETGRQPGWAPVAGTVGELIRGNDICASSTMVNRQAFDNLGGFDERLRSVEDWDMWLRLAKVGRVVGLSEALTAYRVHSGQMSNKTVRMWSWSVWVIIKQRAALRPSIAGVRRMGVVYGAQMFDHFRRDRRPAALAWSFVMWPDYVLRQLGRRISPQQKKGSS